MAGKKGKGYTGRSREHGLNSKGIRTANRSQSMWRQHNIQQPILVSPNDLKNNIEKIHLLKELDNLYDQLEKEDFDTASNSIVTFLGNTVLKGVENGILSTMESLLSTKLATLLLLS